MNKCTDPRLKAHSWGCQTGATLLANNHWPTHKSIWYIKSDCFCSCTFLRDNVLHIVCSNGKCFTALTFFCLQQHDMKQVWGGNKTRWRGGIVEAALVYLKGYKYWKTSALEKRHGDRRTTHAGSPLKIGTTERKHLLFSFSRNWIGPFYMLIPPLTYLSYQ